jgi:hypothetical protein
MGLSCLISFCAFVRTLKVPKRWNPRYEVTLYFTSLNRQISACCAKFLQMLNDEE